MLSGKDKVEFLMKENDYTSNYLGINSCLPLFFINFEVHTTNVLLSAF
jgi:hypothetical protein